MADDKKIFVDDDWKAQARAEKEKLSEQSAKRPEGMELSLPLIDLHGLTDATVARRPLGRRGHVGHEKFASTAYLHRRGVRLVQSDRVCRESRFPLIHRGEAQKTQTHGGLQCMYGHCQSTAK